LIFGNGVKSDRSFIFQEAIALLLARKAIPSGTLRDRSFAAKKKPGFCCGNVGAGLKPAPTVAAQKETRFLSPRFLRQGDRYFISR